MELSFSTRTTPVLLCYFCFLLLSTINISLVTGDIVARTKEERSSSVMIQQQQKRRQLRGGSIIKSSSSYTSTAKSDINDDIVNMGSKRRQVLSTTTTKTFQQVDDDGCPMPEAERYICTREYVPLVCGDDGCQYSNSCQAAAAGFNVTSGLDCIPVQENTNGDSFATMTTKPGSSNNKEENADGLKDPETGVQENTTPGGNGDDVCPRPLGNIACTREYDPVDCSDNTLSQLLCEYSNPCVAKDAGYDSLSNCMKKGSEVVVMFNKDKTTTTITTTKGGGGETKITIEEMTTNDFNDEEDGDECRLPQDGLPCYYIMDPVDCEGCIYDNDCLAEGAGYNATTQCIPHSTNGDDGERYEIMNDNNNN